MSSDPFEKFRKKIRESSHTLNSSNKLIEEDDEPAAENKFLEEKNEETPKTAVEKKVDELEYVFFPKPEITTYDLARILAFTQLSISKDLYQNFPPELQKFFAKFQEVQKNNKTLS